MSDNPQLVSYAGLRKVPRIDLAASVPLPIPLTVHIEPTNICNFNCSFCPVSLPDYAEQSGFYGHMEMGLYHKIIRDLQELGRIKSLKLYFIGEPFLNPELVRMIEVAKVAEVAERIEITTNGSVLPESTAAFLQAGLDYLRASVYSPKPSKITRNIRYLMEARGTLGLTLPQISVKYMPEGPDDLALFNQTYAGVADEIIIEPFHNWASTIVLKPPTPKQNCPFIHYMLVIKANGDVVPCCVDWNAGLKLGNVREQSVLEVWNGFRRQQLIETHILHRKDSLGPCRSCDLPDTTPDNLDHLTMEEYSGRDK